jgi:HEAT repeat protein
MEFGGFARESLPALAKALNDPDPEVRANAATAMEEIAPEAPAEATSQ